MSHCGWASEASYVKNIRIFLSNICNANFIHFLARKFKYLQNLRKLKWDILAIFKHFVSKGGFKEGFFLAFSFEVSTFN